MKPTYSFALIKLTGMLLFILSTSVSAQISPTQSALSEYYKAADTLQISGKYDLAIQYLDSSLMMTNDSLEIAYNWLLRARIYESTEKMDSVAFYYDLLDPLARRLTEPEPLKMALILKGYMLQRDRKLEESNQLIREGLSMWSTNDFMGNYYMGLGYKSLGESYILRNQFDSAYMMIEQMNTHAEADSTGLLLPSTFRTNSWLYFRLGDFEKAIETIKVPFEAKNKNLSNLEPAQSVIAGNIALNYMMLGDYERAEEYILAVTEMHRKNGQTATYGYYQNMLFLAACYLDMEEYEKALEASNAQLSAYREQNADYKTPYYYSSLKTTGRALAGLKRVDEAQQIFDQVIDYQQNLEFNRAPLLRTYLEVGMAKIGLEQHRQALGYLLESLELQRSTDQLRGPDGIPILGNIAEAYFGLKAYDSAMIYMDSAILMNQHYEPYESTKVMRYRAVRWQIELLNTKLEFLREMWSENPSDEIMASALSAIEQTNETIDQARKSIRGDNSRLEIAYDFYDHAVFFYVEKFEQSQNPEDLRMAFSFSENNKSFLLNEISGEASLSRSEKYQDLIAEKARLKSLVSIHAIKEGSTLLYDYFEALDSIQGEIDQVAQYSHFRQVSDQDINRLAGAPIWTMHAGQKFLYTFLLDAGMLTYAKIELDSSFHEEVLDIREALSDPSKPIRQLSIADELMSFVEQLSSDGITIIPDGVLNYIPFELFMRSDSTAFLMDRFNINYRNSFFRIIDDKQKKQPTTSFDLISFAPNFETSNTLASADIVRNELSSIPGAFEEVMGISELFNGKQYLKEMATESNFREAAGQFGMIHLATHALVDDKDPKQSRLVFNLVGDSLNDGYLHVHEIVSLDLNAQIVTLSACNTGFGKIKRGEGVMSLSRAFAYAGVPATVVSLWPASDKSTPELMKYFYQNLKDGQSKDVALNNARKQYLATAKGKARHPFYWGGFVLIGDERPIVGENKWLLPVTTFAGLLVLIGVVFLRRRKSV